MKRFGIFRTFVSHYLGLKYVDSQGRHIQERQIHHFSKADPACGAGVARGLGLGG